MNQIQDRSILSVSQLNRKAKQLLETHLPLLWVEGEISNLARPSSGHWYLSLKDGQAQVRGAMFRGRNQLVKFNPANGQKVLVRARVSIYEGRGDYQLIIEHMQAAGAGDLQLQFDALKQKLQERGLFDPQNKQPPPPAPAHIGVITSPTGAAVRDILQVLGRRSPSTQVSVLPVPVQGDGAAPAIIAAIEMANRQRACDVLLLSRGGGSLEDLWAFNDEHLAYAIAASQIPVVSAVGHEVDFTIADFVADLRAATPSAAAELLSQDQSQQRAQLQGYELLLQESIQRQLRSQRSELQHLRARLRHPGDKLQQQAQRLDQLEQRLQHLWQRQQAERQHRCQRLSLQLRQHSPAQRVKADQRQLDSFAQRLLGANKQQLQQGKQQLGQAAALLHGLSPLATLGRGFALVRDESGQILRSSDKVSVGSEIEAQLHRGRLSCRVEKIQTD
ncbi:MAG: exodeoxyribonuclease VII large subunit [Cellvibrionaceae bacterium]|nr:exodeoxyribonuclease VII large subunit [Cellvibrionaceae bacterium]